MVAGMQETILTTSFHHAYHPVIKIIQIRTSSVTSISSFYGLLGDCALYCNIGLSSNLTSRRQENRILYPISVFWQSRQILKVLFLTFKSELNLLPDITLTWWQVENDNITKFVELLYWIYFTLTISSLLFSRGSFINILHRKTW